MARCHTFSNDSQTGILHRKNGNFCRFLQSVRVTDSGISRHADISHVNSGPNALNRWITRSWNRLHHLFHVFYLRSLRNTSATNRTATQELKEISDRNIDKNWLSLHSQTLKLFSVVQKSGSNEFILTDLLSYTYLVIDPLVFLFLPKSY